MRVWTPIIRIQIADEIFLTGDGYLMNCNIELGEDARSSKCSFTIYDPGLKIGGKFQKISFEQGGIQVPKDLLDSPKVQPTVAATGAATNDAEARAVLGTPSAGGNGVVSNGPQFTPEVKAFMDAIAYGEVEDKLGLSGYTEGNFGQKNTVKNNQFPPGSYTGNNVGRYQFSHDEFDEWLKTNPQVRDFSPQGQDLMCYWRMGVRGCLEAVKAGRFEDALIAAGKEWASIPGSPYGQVHLSKIQWLGYCQQRLAYWKGQSGTTMTPSPAIAANATPAATTTVAKTPEQSVKGTEIIIEAGFDSPSQLIAYHFIHTQTQTKKDKTDTTTFHGQSIRWLLSRRTENATFKDITLKQLAQIVCNRFSLKLQMEGDGPKYAHLDQSGITIYELLRRCCTSIGYKITDKEDTLIIKPWARPEFTGFVITADILESVEFGDKADKDRPMGAASIGATISTPTSNSSDPKASINQQTGAIAQTKPEDRTGTGKPGSTSVATGSNLHPVVGNIVKPGATATKPGATEATTTTPSTTGSPIGLVTATAPSVNNEEKIKLKKTIIDALKIGTTEAQAEAIARQQTPIGSISGQPSTLAAGRMNEIAEKIALKVLADKASVKKTADPRIVDAAQTLLGILPSSVTGLPDQKVGAIAIEEGQVEAALIVDESRRVKGYVSSAQLLTVQELLVLVPGNIIAFESKLFPEPFDREWRIDTIKHSFPGCKTSISFYTPQQQKSTGAVVPAAAAAGGAASLDDFPMRVYKYMKLKGYAIAEGAGQFNIVYVEDVDVNGGYVPDMPDKWNSRRLILEVVAGKPQFCTGNKANWDATTEPGKYYTQHPMNPNGAFRIAFGQFKKAWQFGIHKDHEALIQCGTISGYRDSQQTYKRYGQLYSGSDFAVDQHWGYDYGLDSVQNASAGCLVGRLKSGHREFMAILHSDTRKISTWDTTIIDGKELPKPELTAPTGTFTPVSGEGWRWPVQGTNTCGDYCEFGYARGRLHAGIDLGGAAAADKTIYAAKSGIVKRAGLYGGYGNCVDVDHGDGTWTRYGHNASLSVGLGQTVKVGQAIAVMGGTGQGGAVHYAVHLHFEVHKGQYTQEDNGNNTAVNPRSVLVGLPGEPKKV